VSSCPAAIRHRHFTDLTESGVKRTASRPGSLEHIRIPRRTRRAELCSWKATWKLASESAWPADLSLLEPLMNCKSSAFGLGPKRRKNSASADPGTRRLSLTVRNALNSLPFGSPRSRSVAVGAFAPVRRSRRWRVSSHDRREHAPQVWPEPSDTCGWPSRLFSAARRLGRDDRPPRPPCESNHAAWR
jgi:hypothetical protein